MPIRVSIVEDDERLRRRFADLVGGAEGCVCAGTYASGEEALAALVPAPPDVALVDIQLPGIDGIECVRRLKAAHPDLPMLMLTVFDDSDRVFESLKAGARGYLVKRAQRDELIEAIQTVHEGGAPMSPHVARKVVRYFNEQGPPAPGLERLTDREREVLDRLARGDFYKEIADHLGISINTVRKHCTKIYEKLHVQSRTEAVVRYTQR